MIARVLVPLHALQLAALLWLAHRALFCCDAHYYIDVGRAIFLLYQLGPEGRQRAGAPESQTDPVMRIAAYRAMRRAGRSVRTA